MSPDTGSKNLDLLLKVLNESEISVKELHYIKNENDNFSKASFIVTKRNIHNWDKVEFKLRQIFSDQILIDNSNSAVSIIGEGFSKDNRVVLETINVLKSNNIIFTSLITTSFRLSLLVKNNVLEKTINVLHNYWINKEL